MKLVRSSIEDRLRRAYMSGMMSGDIQARWESRVVPNGWHRPGINGADAYVRKYGRNIGLAKLEALRDFARGQGAIQFAEGLNKYIIARKL